MRPPTICPWCGLMSGEVRQTCKDSAGRHVHGKPKPRARTIDTQQLADRLHAEAMAKLTERKR